MVVTFSFRWSKSEVLAASIMLAVLGCNKGVPSDASLATQDEGIEPTETDTPTTEGANECSTHADCGAEQYCRDGQCAPNEPGGLCDIDLNCVDGEVCDIGECIPGGPGASDMACGGEVYEATAIAPNVLIVLDRSGSMEDELGKQGSKWEIAQEALGTVVTTHDGNVRFGLALYPGLDPDCDKGMGCAPGAIFVDVGPATGKSIIEVLSDAKTCDLGTPTAEELEVLQDYPGLEALDRPNFVLLVTDGQSTCADPVEMVAALRAQVPPIDTFVVGFGGDVDPDELNHMAEAGGTALMGDPKYYQADDAQALVDAFDEIAGSVLSCSYVLELVPPDPDELYVYINGMKIPRDPLHMDGWDYDPNTNQVNLYGSACEFLQSGDAMDLQIVFGCPETG